MSPSLPPGLQVIERGWLSANLVIAGGEHPALVDSGYASHAPQTLQLVQAALLGQTPALLANTHIHSDHCGGNAILQAAFPAMRTLIPPGQAQVVTDWDEQALSFRATGQHCPWASSPGRCMQHPGTTPTAWCCSSRPAAP
jgi:glyoxylase-like metal-dependent hydrolase (beta-lactamase superfamily II)